MNDIPNSDAYEWINEEVPHFLCSDKAIEKTYYFRWWTYRKHIKSTPDGYVITEFLPKVSWSKDYNTINAASAHHVSEGKWLKNGKKYLWDYINFFISGKGDGHYYSSWLLSSVNDFRKLRSCVEISEQFLKECLKYYELWEEQHKTSYGLYWSKDNYDAMEFSISGTKEMKSVSGLRPTLNSYMCGEAHSIADFARELGKSDIEKEYRIKAKYIKDKINELLYVDGIYRPLNLDENGKIISGQRTTKELIGFIPWMFGIPEKDMKSNFDDLLDKNVFHSPYGLTTADISDPDFLFIHTHECMWNGYVWPFATSQTLDALYHFVNEYSNDKKYREMYLKLLNEYAKQHCRKKKSGEIVMWIDESHHPFKDEWSSRELLKRCNWKNSGYIERGKDYNHSTFCDLVLSFILNPYEEDGKIKTHIYVPDEWEYFEISNLFMGENEYEIKYNRKDGLTVNVK